MQTNSNICTMLVICSRCIYQLWHRTVGNTRSILKMQRLDSEMVSTRHWEHWRFSLEWVSEFRPGDFTPLGIDLFAWSGWPGNFSASLWPWSIMKWHCEEETLNGDDKNCHWVRGGKWGQHRGCGRGVKCWKGGEGNISQKSDFFCFTSTYLFNPTKSHDVCIILVLYTEAENCNKKWAELGSNSRLR